MIDLTWNACHSKAHLEIRSTFAKTRKYFWYRFSKNAISMRLVMMKEIFEEAFLTASQYEDFSFPYYVKLNMKQRIINTTRISPWAYLLILVLALVNMGLTPLLHDRGYSADDVGDTFLVLGCCILALHINSFRISEQAIMKVICKVKEIPGWKLLHTKSSSAVKQNSSNKKLCLQQRGDLDETETRARAEREREQERIKSIPFKRCCIKKKRNVRKPATQRNRTWPCHECFLSHSTKLSMIKWEFQLRERHIA